MELRLGVSSYDGVIFKLEQNGISGDLLNILVDFLSNRKQRVVLNGQISAWASVNAEVLEGSILGPFRHYPRSYYFLFISMTYPITYYLILNYLLTIHLCFLLPMM